MPTTEEDVTEVDIMVAVATEVAGDIMEEVTDVVGVAIMVAGAGVLAGRLLIHTITIPITTIPDPFTITLHHTNET